MISNSNATPEDQGALRVRSWHRSGRPVRLAIVNWPTVAIVLATVTAAYRLSSVPKATDGASVQTLVAHKGTITSIAYRSDGAMFFSVSADGSTAIWNAASPMARSPASWESGDVRSAAFSPDDRLLATLSRDGPITLRDLVNDDRRHLRDPIGSSSDLTCLAFSPDGKTLAVGDDGGQISLWDVSSRSRPSTLGLHRGCVGELAFAPDGQTLASCGDDHAVRIWDLSAHRERFAISMRALGIAAPAFSPDGRLLALADPAGPVVQLWNVATQSEHAILRGPSGVVTAMAISADGATLAAADYKGSITFWDLPTLELVPRQFKHAGVRALAFAPDGSALASGGFDGIIHVWDWPITRRN